MRSLKVISLAAAALVGATGIASSTEFNVSTWAPENHPLARMQYVEWVKQLEAESGGSLEPTLFLGPVLLPPAGHLSGLRDGIAQVGYHAGTYTPSDLPEDNLIAQLAFNYSDPLVAAFATTEANLTIPELQAMWGRHNVVYLSGYSTPPYNLICTSELKTLGDLEGKKIRVPGAAHSDWAKSAGAIPVNVSITEMYGGLDKGQLDCAAVAANELQSRSIWDVAKHAHMVGLGVYWAGYMHGANRDFWNDLSPEQREVFYQTIPTAIVDGQLDYLESVNGALKLSADHGVTVYPDIAGVAASVETFKSQARADAIALGNSKFGLENSDAIVSQFEAIAAKWEGLLSGKDRTDRDVLIALVAAEIYDKIDHATYGIE